MEDIPEGSGGEEPPEGLIKSAEDRAKLVYGARMVLFAEATQWRAAKRRTRRFMSDYTAKNCEEAWGGRERGSAA